RDRYAADRRGNSCQAEGVLERALDTEGLLDEIRDAVALVSQELLDLRAFADHLEHLAEKARRGLLTRGKEVRGDQHDVPDLGQRAVGKRRGGEARHHVVPRFAPTIGDVAREPLVEELERLVRHLATPARPELLSLAAALELLAERRVLALGNA